MQPSGDNGVVRYTILDETGPDGILLFGCESHPDKKLTSYMLETHMRTQHEARKFTVSVPPPATVPDAIIKVEGVLTKKAVEKTEQLRPDQRNERRRYDRPVPGPRQPRRD